MFTKGGVQLLGRTSNLFNRSFINLLYIGLNAREGICCFGLTMTTIEPVNLIEVLMPVRAFVVLVFEHLSIDEINDQLRLNAREGICCFGPRFQK